jgi:hypothetical protein
MSCGAMYGETCVIVPELGEVQCWGGEEAANASSGACGPLPWRWSNWKPRTVQGLPKLGANAQFVHSRASETLGWAGGPWGPLNMERLGQRASPLICLLTDTVNGGDLWCWGRW